MYKKEEIKWEGFIGYLSFEKKKEVRSEMEKSKEELELKKAGCKAVDAFWEGKRVYIEYSGRYDDSEVKLRFEKKIPRIKLCETFTGRGAGEGVSTAIFQRLDREEVRKKIEELLE